jgi:rsbT co-antagonist protein RsbR
METQDQSEILGRQRSLRQFAVSQLVLAVGATCCYLGLWVTTGIWHAGVLVVVCLLYTIGAVVVYLLAGRGYLGAPIALNCVLLVAATFANAVLAPGLLPLLVLLPILTLAIALPFVSGRAMVALSAAVVIETGLLGVIGMYTRWFEPLPTNALQLLIAIVTPTAASMIVILLLQYGSRLRASMAATHAANSELRALRDGLERQVSERTAALQEALVEVEARSAEQARLLAENVQQRDTLRELSVPILPLPSRALVMPLIGALDTQRIAQAQTRALEEIVQTRAKHLILDITGVPVVDTQVAQGLVQIVQAARLLGATVVLAGIRPEVAQSLVGLGVSLGEVVTRATLEDGVAYTLERR